MENMTATELKQIHEDKIKSLREFQAKIEKMYEIGAYDIADNLEMACDCIIDELIEIDELLGQ